MFGLNKLFTALARLTTAIDRLANTTDEVNAGIRGSVGLDSQPIDISTDRFLPSVEPEVNGTAKKGARR